MNPFFDDLAQRWVVAAERRGVDITAPELDAKVAFELLELARVAAHTQERRFAPLSCYLAGVAAARLGSHDPEAVAEYINEVRQELEGGTPSSRSEPE